LFANQEGTGNGDVLEAIFTDGGAPLAFDTGGSLQGLSLLIGELKGIHVAGGALTGTTP
jgi:hypothetical protein